MDSLLFSSGQQELALVNAGDSWVSDIQLEREEKGNGELDIITLRDTPGNILVPVSFTDDPDTINTLHKRGKISHQTVAFKLSEYEKSRWVTQERLGWSGLWVVKASYESIHGHHDVKILLWDDANKYKEPVTDTPLSFEQMDFIGTAWGKDIFIAKWNRFWLGTMTGWSPRIFLLAITSDGVEVADFSRLWGYGQMMLETNFEIFLHDWGVVVLESYKERELSLRLKDMENRLGMDETIGKIPQKDILTQVVSPNGATLTAEQVWQTKQTVMFSGFRPYHPIVAPDEKTLERKLKAMKWDTPAKVFSFLAE
jgi:hypothetical protein